MDSTISKPKVLFIPAWWPCSFFKEQQDVYNELYEIYNLWGHCKFLSIKKSVAKVLRGKRIFDISIEHGDDRIAHINMMLRKLKSFESFNRQIKKVSDRIGECIVNFMGSEPDIVSIQSISDLAVFVVDWAKRRNIKVVLTEHILYVRNGFDLFSKRREQLYSQADKVFCVSNYLYRNLLTSGFKMKDVSVIGNLVNDYAVPTDWSIVKKNGRVMFVASHTSDKDIPTLLKVCEHLRESDVKIDVFGLTGEELIGDGRSLKDLIEDKSIDGCISVKGKFSHTELLEKYAEYSLLLSTSVSETFGLSVAEAIAHGTPVVCTDSGGINDFVNTKNGVIVPIKDVEKIISGIKVVFSSIFDAELMSVKILRTYGCASYKKSVLS